MWHSAKDEKTAQEIAALLKEAEQNLSEEVQHKLRECAGELFDKNVSKCGYYNQKGFEDGLVFEKIVCSFDSSEILSWSSKET